MLQKMSFFYSFSSAFPFLLQVVLAEQSLTHGQKSSLCLRGFTREEDIVEVDQELAKGQAVFNGQSTYTNMLS